MSRCSSCVRFSEKDLLVLVQEHMFSERPAKLWLFVLHSIRLAGSRMDLLFAL